MILSCAERITILGLSGIPQFGNIITLRIVNDLMRVVGFTEQEIADWKIVTVPEEGTVTWNPSKSVDVEIDLTPKMVSMLVTAMEKADNLPLHALVLYDKLKDQGGV